MSNDSISFKINRKELEAPIEWEDVKVLATFDNENNQANITTDRWTFIGNAKDEIINFRKANGVFQGPCFDIFASDDDGAFQLFEGFLDYTKDYEEIDFKSANFEDPNKVMIGAQKLAGLNSLDDLINGTTIGKMLQDKVFTDSDYVDIEWVAEKKFDFLQFAIASVTLYLMVKEGLEASFRLADQIASFIGFVTGGGLTGPIGAVAYQVIILGAQIIYTGLIIAQIIALTQDLINTLIAPKRTHKGIYLRTLMEKGFESFGYTFVSPISDLDKYAYLPTLPLAGSDFTNPILNRVKVITEGVPSVRDYGYLYSECVELCLSLFNARLSVVDGLDGKEVHLRTIDDPWWIKQSNLDIIDDKLIESVKLNTEDLSKNVFLKFIDDRADDWTVDNYTGTSYEVITNVESIKDPRKVTIKGIDEEVFPVALGNDKDGFSLLEETLLALFSAIDGTINLLGGNSNLSSLITNRLGLLKISSEVHTVPKLLYLINGRIPEDHRNFLSAKYLYNNYHNEKSFIANNFKKQRVLFNSEKVPFRFRDFKQLINNNYFITPSGMSGKITKCEWSIGADFAVVDGWFQKIYDTNLIETTNEP